MSLSTSLNKMIQSVVDKLQQSCQGDNTGGTLISKLCYINLNEIQPIQSEQFTTLKSIFKEISSRVGTNKFTTDERNDFTLYLGCLLKLQIYPTPDILEFFVSHRQVPIEPAELRTNYYNYRKNKKMTELQDILNITAKEIQSDYQKSTQSQDNQSQRFLSFYFAWLHFVNGNNTKLLSMCNDVLIALESSDEQLPQDKKLQEIIEIKNLEKQINQKMSQQNRMELIQPKEMEQNPKKIPFAQIQQQRQKPSDQFYQVNCQRPQYDNQLTYYMPETYQLPAQQNVGVLPYQDLFPHQTQQQQFPYTDTQMKFSYINTGQPQMSNPTYQNYHMQNQQDFFQQHQYQQPQQQFQMHSQHSVNLTNIFNMINKDNDQIHQQQNNNTQEFSLLSDFNGLTNQTKTDPLNNFININKPVINEKENVDEVSNALLHLAMGEKSEQEDSKVKDKNIASLFSSFM